MAESMQNPDEDILAESRSVGDDPHDDDLTHISEMRLVIESDDWDTALAFYRDALGLRQIHGYQGDTEAQVILDVGRATIELVHPSLPEPSEPGVTDLTSPPVPRARLAFRTSQAQSVVKRLEDEGATRTEGPKLNAADTISVRLVGPDKLPFTIFRPLGSSDFAEASEPRESSD